MSDGSALQILLVALAALTVVAVALATRRFQRPAHPRVELHGTGLPAGIVIFTSTECSSCKDALAEVRNAGVPLREVTWELERATFESVGVTAVPLTLVVDSAGTVLDQIVGVPRRRRLLRAVAALGEANGA